MERNANESRFAAMFIDYENIYYFLKKELGTSTDAVDTTVDLFRKLRTKLLTDGRGDCIVQHAYADFEQVQSASQGQLFLLGIETHNVLGTDHKNAADMRLCIDALEVLYTRPEIRTFVLLAGDRDYIPLILHLKKHAKEVTAVAFRRNVSGDLLQIVGEINFIAAEDLLDPEIAQALRQPAQPQSKPIAVASVSPPPTSKPRTQPATKFEPSVEILDEDEYKALVELIESFGRHPEVFLMPYLNHLRRKMAGLAEYERKALITSMADHGAIAVEKRQGEPNDYSVIIINWNHPSVKAANPG